MGAIMQSTILRSAILFVGSCLLVVSFQNCGQPGGISAGADMQKSGGDPLVVDVVAEMDNQNPPNPYDYGKKEDGYDYEDDKDYADDKDYDDDKDVKYDDELEDVLKNYACEDSSMSAQSKKVLICHYPKGNPDNRHEICIGRPALKAHLSQHQDSAHKDHLGDCDDEDSDDDDSAYGYGSEQSSQNANSSKRRK